jgi:very-short-patch-repair endonuclease
MLSSVSVRRPLSSVPRLTGELDDERFEPDDLGVSSATVVWWRCEHDNRHRWTTDVKGRSAGTQRAQCPWCRGVATLPDDHNPALRSSHPELATEWDSQLPNLGLPPSDLITASVNIAIRWRCPRNEYHDPILATPGELAFGQHKGCRHCWANDQVADVAPGTAIARGRIGATSRAEQQMFDQLARHLRLSKALSSVRTARPFYKFVWVTPDIVIPQRRVAVEYDSPGRPGEGLHGGSRRDADLLKDQLLREVGWEVVRLRTGGLTALGPYDVVAPGYSQRAVAEVATMIEKATTNPPPN